MAYLGGDRPPPARPRARHRDHLGDVLAAVRAPHPGGEFRQRHRPPGDPRERFRFDVPGRAAGTGDAHEEVAQGVVELLDVGKHAQARMVLTAGESVHAVRGRARNCMTCHLPGGVFVCDIVRSFATHL